MINNEFGKLFIFFMFTFLKFELRIIKNKTASAEDFKFTRFDWYSSGIWTLRGPC